MPPQESAVLVAGPWTHREVSANGARFHVAEIGRGPLVLLLHGFPEFWWSWRHQLVALADAGFRAVAPDLRGYGASDKPPRGYDIPTLAHDVAGMIRALGEREAIVVGHDWGALIGWTVATLHPDAVRRLAALSMPHPLRLREAAARDPAQRRAGAYVLRFQLPRLPERWLTQDDARNVSRLLSAWSGPGWPDPEAQERYREAMGIPGVVHSALEYHRWAIRSLARPDGLRAARQLTPGIAAPTLHLHGALDPVILPTSAVGSGRYVQAPYEWCLLPGVGHFPHEEAPDAVNELLIRWAGGARPSARDRDGSGRPRNARRRDATGRPLPRGAVGHPPTPDAPALPPPVALAEAERLLLAGRPFSAHEVLEAVWKGSPTAERELWRGLAQVAVGLTHAQRGNPTGAAELLRRGSARLDAYAAAPPYGVDVPGLIDQARALASGIADGVPVEDDDLRLALRSGQSPLGNG